MPNFEPKPVMMVVDDDQAVGKALSGMLTDHGYQVIYLSSPLEALKRFKEFSFDLVISDIRMPGMTGYELVAEIRKDATTEYVPVILITGSETEQEKTKGLNAGADDFLQKPFNKMELLARVRSLLKIRMLNKETLEQAAQLTELNRSLEEKVKQQVEELSRLSKLKRFFSPRIAELIVSDTDENPLKTHRKEVSVLFVDLRGFTSFAESGEPEEVIEVLGQYYEIVGKLALSHDGTLGYLAGDGMMVFFNDPINVPNHREQAIKMAFAARDALEGRAKMWNGMNYHLGFGIGITDGYGTIGGFGFNEFWNYSVVGTVTNLASRLCANAQSGEILVSNRFYSNVSGLVHAEQKGELNLKGLHHSIETYNLTQFKKRAS